eukprot:728727-Rhodomonas_salina.2
MELPSCCAVCGTNVGCGGPRKGLELAPGDNACMAKLAWLLFVRLPFSLFLSVSLCVCVSVSVSVSAKEEEEEAAALLTASLRLDPGSTPSLCVVSYAVAGTAGVYAAIVIRGCDAQY